MMRWLGIRNCVKKADLLSLSLAFRTPDSHALTYLGALCSQHSGLSPAPASLVGPVVAVFAGRGCPWTLGLLGEQGQVPPDPNRQTQPANSAATGASKWSPVEG